MNSSTYMNLNASSKSFSDVERRSGKKERKRKRGNKLYRFFYYVGMQVIRSVKRTKRRIGRLLMPVRDFGIMLYQKGIVNRLTRMSNEFKDVKSDWKYAMRRMKKARKTSAKEAMIEPLRVASDGIRKHKHFFSKVFNIVAPVLSIALLVLTVNHYLNLNYALKVEYGNETIGYVENEAVYTRATEIVNERIVGSSGDSMDSNAKFTLAVVDDDELLSADEVCDSVLGMTDGEFEQAYGLVVNGEMIGAIKSAGDMQFILDDFLESYKENTECEKVEFIDDISIEEGYYPKDSVKTSDELKTEITTTHTSIEYYTIKNGDSPIAIAEKNNMSVARLQELNPDLDEVMYAGAKVKVDVDKPVLGVKSISYSTYYKSIAYSTKTVEDSTKYTDYKKLQTPGQKGKERYVEEVTYVDGEEISRVLVEKVVEVQPVDAVYVVGTKKRPVVTNNPKPNNPTTNKGDNTVGKGKFAWPVPGVRSISSPYGMRWGRMHKGIDISCSGIKGRTIVAAASGTVTTKGYDANGYGNYCIITHANGYSTLYGHCLSLSVSKGQTVSKGQAIGKVGSTGRSTGPHLHYEIRVNGSRKNPMNYY